MVRSAVEESAGLVNDGDLAVTALSLKLAVTVLRVQPAAAGAVCDKVGRRQGGAANTAFREGALGGGSRPGAARCDRAVCPVFRGLAAAADSLAPNTGKPGRL